MSKTIKATRVTTTRDFKVDDYIVVNIYSEKLYSGNSFIIRVEDVSEVIRVLQEKCQN